MTDKIILNIQHSDDYTVHHPMRTWSCPVTGDIDAGSITVNTGYYIPLLLKNSVRISDLPMP